MRLIDADVLMDNISKKPSLNLFIHAKNIEAAIDETPTIDAEPVRHGRWVPKKVGAVTTEFECSECGRTVTLTNDYFGKATKYASSYYPYCHCGAKMRGDKDADE